MIYQNKKNQSNKYITASVKKINIADNKYYYYH